MKNTLITNACVKIINEIINDLSLYCVDETDMFCALYPVNCFKELRSYQRQINKIDIENIKQEFIETLEDYSKIFFLKKVFEFKFEILLNWKHDFSEGINENLAKYSSEMYVFLDIQNSKGMDINSNEFSQLKDAYITLSASVTSLKKRMKSMLEHFDVLGRIYIESQNLSIAENTNNQQVVKAMVELTGNDQINFAINRKTDFIKLVSAMYDMQMFVKADGSKATNKKKLFQEFSKIFDTNFSDYSSSLTQSKISEKETFMKPFWEITQNGEEYYNRKNEN